MRWGRVILTAFVVFVVVAGWLYMKYVHEEEARERLWRKLSRGYHPGGSQNLRECLEKKGVYVMKDCVEIDEAVEKAMRR